MLQWQLRQITDKRAKIGLSRRPSDLWRKSGSRAFLERCGGAVCKGLLSGRRWWAGCVGFRAAQTVDRWRHRREVGMQVGIPLLSAGKFAASLCGGLRGVDSAHLDINGLSIMEKRSMDE